jgi:hypothetical protein
MRNLRGCKDCSSIMCQLPPRSRHAWEGAVPWLIRRLGKLPFPFPTAACIALRPESTSSFCESLAVGLPQRCACKTHRRVGVGSHVVPVRGAVVDVRGSVRVNDGGCATGLGRLRAHAMGARARMVNWCWRRGVVKRLGKDSCAMFLVAQISEIMYPNEAVMAGYALFVSTVNGHTTSKRWVKVQEGV